MLQLKLHKLIMERKVMPGRVLVKKHKDQEVIDGLTIPELNAVREATVLDIGAPLRELYSEEELDDWDIDGIHPSGIKKGDTILMPNVGARIFVKDGETFHILFTAEIEMFWETKI